MAVDSLLLFQQLLSELSPVLATTTDGSHDLSHLERVWHTARLISSEEGGDLKVVAAAVILHDCVAVEKDSPLRGQASRLSAEKAATVLEQREWSSQEISEVAEAILTHSYSAGLEPTTLEGRILQDADRLDAIGAVGIARCFYTAGRMGSKLYDPADPQAGDRDLDDRSYALDHFPAKLLRLATGFQTRTGTRMAQERYISLKIFYEAFMEEIGASSVATKLPPATSPQPSR
jgi:uncharacterized protein